MKKYLVLMFISFSFILWGQNKKELNRNSQKIYEFTVQGEYDSLMNYTYPKLFDMVPKKNIIDAMTKSFHNDEFNITVLPHEPNFSFSEIKKIDGNYYSLIEHDLYMKLDFFKAMEPEELSVMVDLFKLAMETDDVSVKDKSIFIGKRSAMIAMSEKQYNYRWYFVNNDKGSVFLNSLIPERVQEELGLKD